MTSRTINQIKADPNGPTEEERRMVETIRLSASRLLKAMGL